MKSTDPPTRWEVRIPDVAPGARYEIMLDGAAVPDPFARFLPAGVHGSAEVVPAGRGTALPTLAAHDWSIYELHIGTFTAEGTFTAAIARLDDLVDLGVTAIELMPIAAFDGHHGWGYDGVALYAPHAAYGTPQELRALINAAHARGLAVVLDVVYNHFGPAGNYLPRYAPQYFTEHVKTPWGAGPDFTWPPMRRLVLENVTYWLDEFGFDGLRLDATHAIEDPSPTHILTDITALAHERGRVVFFEDERNDPRVFAEHHADGVWADDLHHQIHVLLTEEQEGYYSAHNPTTSELARCIREGWIFSGQAYAPWEGRPRGKPFADAPRRRLITCIQNHDQIGNRAFGDRLSTLVNFDAYCAAVALLLFLPSTPLLFMGQEWGASTPFLYFSDHAGELGEKISEGRRKELAAFATFTGCDVPDPQARSTFERSRLNWNERNSAANARVLAIHRTLLHLRREDPVLRVEGEIEAVADGELLRVTRRVGHRERSLFLNFAEQRVRVPLAKDASLLFTTAPEPITRHDDHFMIPPSTAVVIASESIVEKG